MKMAGQSLPAVPLPELVSSILTIVDAIWNGPELAAIATMDEVQALRQHMAGDSRLA
jgi:hypothetical protein